MNEEELNSLNEFFNWDENPYCKGCIHSRSINNRTSRGKVCHYLLDTGHVRGCPVGDKCTRKETRQTSR